MSVEKRTEQIIHGAQFVEFMSITPTGDVMIVQNDSILCKISLQQDGSYIEQWRHQIPEDMCTKGCPIYFTDTDDVIMQNFQKNCTTSLFDQYMKLKDSWRHQGLLIGCLPGPRTVYANRNLVEIRSQNGELTKLKFETAPWDKAMSVCEDGRTGKLVFVRADLSIELYGKTKYRIHHRIIIEL